MDLQSSDSQTLSESEADLNRLATLIPYYKGLEQKILEKDLKIKELTVENQRLRTEVGAVCSL